MSCATRRHPYLPFNGWARCTSVCAPSSSWPQTSGTCHVKLVATSSVSPIDAPYCKHHSRTYTSYVFTSFSHVHLVLTARVASSVKDKRTTFGISFTDRCCTSALIESSCSPREEHAKLVKPLAHGHKLTHVVHTLRMWHLTEPFGNRCRQIGLPHHVVLPANSRLALSKQQDGLLEKQDHLPVEDTHHRLKREVCNRSHLIVFSGRSFLLRCPFGLCTSGDLSHAGGEGAAEPATCPVVIFVPCLHVKV
jgi:hypothetical protein